MNKIFMAFLAFIFTVSVQAAESPETEKVEKLFELMETEKMLESMYAQMEGMMSGMAQQMGVKPEEKEIFDAYMAKVVEIMEQEMSWKDMKAEMVKIYAKHYTAEELDGMLDFFSSDAGRAMTAKNPIIMQESMMLSQKLMQNILPKMQQAAQEMKASLDAKRQQESAQNPAE